MAQPADKTESLFPDIIELNVGGQVYVTRHETLLAVPNSRLWSMFNGSARSSPGEQLGRDRKGRFFIDRDGFLFRYILDYLRNLTLVLPDYFTERASLLKEADFFQLHDLSARLRSSPSKDGNSPLHGNSPEENVLLGALASTSLAAAASSPSSTPNPCLSPSPGAVDPRKSHGYITIGYRGSYTIGRDIQTDHKFRRVARITVCGKTSLAKEVFGENLNESRDPDRPPERYTSRYYLKYNFLEQAFDQLAEAGFHMVACSSTGTCAYTSNDPNEDKVWSSYTEYVFCRD